MSKRRSAASNKAASVVIWGRPRWRAIRSSRTTMSACSDKRPAAVFDLQTLRQKVSGGEIDTVLIVFPDTYGRLLGKRLVASYFLDHCSETGTHGCNYLLTVNLEMDPLEGFR